MANLNTIKGYLSGALASVAVIGATALPAYAEDVPKATPVAASVQTPVPTSDARTVSERAVRFAAAQQSNDAQVLIYFGEDAKVFAALRDGARDVLDAGELPLRGIIIAAPKEGEWVAAHAIEIYTDGTRSRTIRNPSPETARNIEVDLAEDLERSLAIAALPSPDLDG